MAYATPGGQATTTSVEAPSVPEMATPESELIGNVHTLSNGFKTGI